MTVTLRHTRTGLIALAAAGIFAAGTVGQRASEIYSGYPAEDEQEVEAVAGPASLVAAESG